MNDGDLHNTNLETQCTPHKSHDAIKSREDDRDDQEAKHRERANGNLHNAAEVHRTSHKPGALGDRCRVQTEQDFEGGDDGARVEWDLGERDDGDEGAHEEGQNLGVAGLEQDVGGDFVADHVAEHEQAGDCSGCI